jgi:hypothetical protein
LNQKEKVMEPNEFGKGAARAPAPAIDARATGSGPLIYLPISVGAALLFLAASLLADYPPVARLGGTVWVGLLSLIVSMPVVTARIRRRRSEH